MALCYSVDTPAKKQNKKHTKNKPENHNKIMSFLGQQAKEVRDQERKSVGQFWKPSDIENNTSVKMQIYGDPVAYFEGWTVDKKPVRWGIQDESPNEKWATDNYGKLQSGALNISFLAYIFGIGPKLVSVSQGSIIDELESMSEDPNLGPVQNYNILIKKTAKGEGKKKKTEYNVMSAPNQEPLTDEQIDAIKALNCDLGRIPLNQNPFGDSEKSSDTDHFDDDEIPMPDSNKLDWKSYKLKDNSTLGDRDGNLDWFKKTLNLAKTKGKNDIIPYLEQAIKDNTPIEVDDEPF